MTTLHICRGVNRRYVTQVRQARYRRWTTVSTSLSYKHAVLAMARTFAKGSYKRGRVLLTADYYDPVVIVEMHREIAK